MHNSFYEPAPEQPRLYVPQRYRPDSSMADNVVYALSQLVNATVEDVAEKLADLEPATLLSVHRKIAEKVLSDLSDKGLIAGKGTPTVYRVTGTEAEDELMQIKQAS